MIDVGLPPRIEEGIFLKGISGTLSNALLFNTPTFHNQRSTLRAQDDSSNRVENQMII